MSTQYPNPTRPASTLVSRATPGWWDTVDGRFTAAHVAPFVMLVDTCSGARFQVADVDEAQRWVERLTRRDYLAALAEECLARGDRDSYAARVLAELRPIAAMSDSDIYWTVDADGTEWAVQR